VIFAVWFDVIKELVRQNAPGRGIRGVGDRRATSPGRTFRQGVRHPRRPWSVSSRRPASTRSRWAAWIRRSGSRCSATFTSSEA
jgi:hypothetical protein